MMTCEGMACSGRRSASMKDLEQVDGRDADERGGELHFEHADMHVVERLGLIRVVVETEPGDERLVAADHEHVDEPEHGEHDRRAGRRGDCAVPGSDGEQMPQLREDQPGMERSLHPASGEDEALERIATVALRAKANTLRRRPVRSAERRRGVHERPE